MTPIFQFSERINSFFTPSSRGNVGLVDDFLEFCRDRNISLSYLDLVPYGQCRIRARARTSKDDSGDFVDVPLRKSVFRTILARFAALCNEQVPNSVSPYGGEGVLTHATDPPATFQVFFVNTPNDQKMDLIGQGEPNWIKNLSENYRHYRLPSGTRAARADRSSINTSATPEST